MNLCHPFFTVHLSPRRPHFVLVVRQRSPEFSAVLLVSLYEMMYVDARQGHSPERASCLASEAPPSHKILGGSIAQILCFGRASRESNFLAFSSHDHFKRQRSRSPLLSIPPRGNVLKNGAHERISPPTPCLFFPRAYTR